MNDNDDQAWKKAEEGEERKQFAICELLQLSCKHAGYCVTGILMEGQESD